MKKKDLRVLFICKKRVDTYGISKGLVNSAQFLVNFLTALGIEAKLVTVIDGNGIDKVVHAFKPTHVVLEAIWCPPYKMAQLLAIPRYKDIIWQVRIHSKIPFIANEGTAMKWLCAYSAIADRHSNFHIVGNHRSFVNALHLAMGIEGHHLPNVYCPDDSHIQCVSEKQSDNFVDIGCFGAIRPMKNQLLQAMAAMAFGNKIDQPIRFHINGSRTEQKGDQVLKNIRNLFACHTNTIGHELVEHGWLSHMDFLKLIVQMDIGMQVSLSETFNIVAADMIASDIPVIVSHEIEWMPFYRKVTPNKITPMVNKLYHTWDCDLKLFRTIDKLALKRYNKKAGKKWLKYLYSTI